jgi:hypothetical protein
MSIEFASPLHLNDHVARELASPVAIPLWHIQPLVDLSTKRV